MKLRIRSYQDFKAAKHLVNRHIPEFVPSLAEAPMSHVEEALSAALGFQTSAAFRAVAIDRHTDDATLLRFVEAGWLTLSDADIPYIRKMLDEHLAVANENKYQWRLEHARQCIADVVLQEMPGWMCEVDVAAFCERLRRLGHLLDAGNEAGIHGLLGFVIGAMQARGAKVTWGLSEAKARLTVLDKALTGGNALVACDAVTGMLPDSEWRGVTQQMVWRCLPALCWARDHAGLSLTAATLLEHLKIMTLVDIDQHGKFPDMPQHMRASIRNFLLTLPAYHLFAENKRRLSKCPSQTTLDQYGAIWGVLAASVIRLLSVGCVPCA